MKTVEQGLKDLKQANPGLQAFTKDDMFFAGASFTISVLLGLTEETEDAAAGILDGLRVETDAHFGHVSTAVVTGNLHTSRVA